MTKLLETIRFEWGNPVLLVLHQERMERSLRTLWGEDCPLFQNLHNLGLEAILNPMLQNQPFSAVDKVRFIYDGISISEFSLTPYTLRPIQSLQPIPWVEGVDYSYKFADRMVFEMATERLPSGTLPIFIRHGQMLSDTTYTNIILEMEDGLYTPTDSLLCGVQQTHLLHQGIVQMRPLSLDDFQRASAVHLINAMIPLGALRLELD